MELSREVKLRIKLQKQAVRVRDKNRAEKRLLQRRFRQLSAGSQRSEALIDREIRRIKDDIWRQEGLEEFLAGNVETASVPCRANAESFEEKRKRAQSAPVYRSHQNGYSQLPEVKECFTTASTTPLPYSCQFEARRHNCNHFPCNKQVHYTKLGFDIKSKDGHCNSFTTAQQMFAKSREGFIMDLESHSIRRPQRTSMDQTNHKISALRTIIVEMKQKSEANRPQDWCINYGKPISKRKLLKVARPSSRSDILGL